jgi:hypothetical protein
MPSFGKREAGRRAAEFARWAATDAAPDSRRSKRQAVGRCGRSQRSQALVEFALVSPLLLRPESGQGHGLQTKVVVKFPPVTPALSIFLGPSNSLYLTQTTVGEELYF